MHRVFIFVKEHERIPPFPNICFIEVDSSIIYPSIYLSALRHLLYVTLHSVFVRIVLSLLKLPPHFAVRNWFGTRDCNPRRNIRWNSWRRRRVGVQRALYRASVRPGRCYRYPVLLSCVFFFLIVRIVSRKH